MAKDPASARTKASAVAEARKGEMPAEARAKGYLHAGKTMTGRPEVGAAPRFKAKHQPATYRYDSSLSPSLEWDSNPAREVGAFLLDCIEAAATLPSPHLFPEPRVLRGAGSEALLRVAGLQDALAELKKLQRPFLNWAGKAERLSFEVATLPLFVHERLSTSAIIETLKAHLKQPEQSRSSLFSDPQRPLSEQVRAFEHRDSWVNRMILGDSLVVMNSLLRFEGLGGQGQMIYIDPPYGVKFGSNFQPFVRKRGSPVDNDDEHLVRDPEVVQAYRDTWRLGLHSYLDYLRDRLLTAHDLPAITGSIFVQISDDNVHHVRGVMDEIFGEANFVSQIFTNKTTGAGSPGELTAPPAVGDYVLWYAKDAERKQFRKLFRPKVFGGEGSSAYSKIELPDGTR